MGAGTSMRRHRAEVFARRDAGGTVSVQDLLRADAYDDAADPDAALARLHKQAAALTARTGTKHHVWHVPAEGLRPAATCVLPATYAQPNWVAA